jgi:hypothetical protein
MTTQGINVRQTTGQLIFDLPLINQFAAAITSGTAELRVLRINDDGTLDVYDWTTNDFVATGSGTPDDETTMTQQQRRDSSGADVDTGIWTKVLSTLTNWTVGRVYRMTVYHVDSSPQTVHGKFQFGGAEGDLTVTSGNLETDCQTIEGNAALAAIEGEVVDAVTILETTVVGDISTTQFTFQSGTAATGAFNRNVIAVQDADDSHWEVRRIVSSTLVIATTTIVVDTAFTFTPAIGDVLRIMAVSYNFDPANDTVANVSIVDTTTTVTDGAKASVCTEARLAELDAANLPKTTDDIRNIQQ